MDGCYLVIDNVEQVLLAVDADFLVDSVAVALRGAL